MAHGSDASSAAASFAGSRVIARDGVERDVGDRFPLAMGAAGASSRSTPAPQLAAEGFEAAWIVEPLD
jgi:hypothetical protein